MECDLQYIVECVYIRLRPGGPLPSPPSPSGSDLHIYNYTQASRYIFPPLWNGTSLLLCGSSHNFMLSTSIQLIMMYSPPPWRGTARFRGSVILHPCVCVCGPDEEGEPPAAFVRIERAASTLPATCSKPEVMSLPTSPEEMGVIRQAIRFRHQALHTQLAMHPKHDVKVEEHFGIVFRNMEAWRVSG